VTRPPDLARDRGLTRDDVEVVEKATVYKGRFQVDRYRLRHKRHDGTWSEPFLREVFERARDFGQARTLIETTPIAAPTIFTLAGLTPEETCVIERTERDHVTHLGPCTAANTWHYADFRDGWSGRDSDPHSDSAERRRSIEALGRHSLAAFAWVVPPVRNGVTRLAVELDPGRGTLSVRGYEQVGDGSDAEPVTADLHVTF